MTPPIDPVPPPPLPWRTRLRVCAPAAILALVAGLFTVGYDFVQDDFPLIPKNPAIRSLSRIPGMFATPYLSYLGIVGRGVDYRPLPLVTFAFEYAVVGAHPALYHLDNVLLHAGISVLVAIWALGVLRDPVAAALAGVLFAVLPVHCDNVANVAERSTLLAAAFGLAAAIRHAAPGGAGSPAAALLLFLSLLSKESAIAFPALFVLQDFLRDGPGIPPTRILLRRYGPILLAVAAYLAIRAALPGGPTYGAGFAYFDREPYAQVLPTMARFFFSCYLGPAVCGFHRSSDYSFRSFATSEPGDPAGWLAALVLLSGAGAVTVGFFRRPTPARLGLVWFLVALLPVSNLVVGIMIIGAERQLYLPTLGLCLAGGVLLARPARSSGARKITLGRLGVALYLGWCLAQFLAGCAGWRDQRTFYDGVLAACPDNLLALSGRALLAADPEESARALPDAARAVRVAPESVAQRYALAWTLLQAGHPAAARFSALAGLARDDARTPHRGRYLVGLTLHAEGRAAEGADRQRESLALRADHAPALAALAEALFDAGEAGPALEAVDRLCALDPDDLWAGVLRCRILLGAGRLAEAAAGADRIVSQAPGSAAAQAALGAIALAARDENGARDLLSEAARREPDARAAHALLAEALDRSGDPAGAADERRLSLPGGRGLELLARLDPAERRRREVAELERVLALCDDPGRAGEIRAEIGKRR